MSLITQCPACTTLFKVVPDQLRISDGWVRCGQCDEVFDANAHLQTAVPAPTRPAGLQPGPESRQAEITPTQSMGLSEEASFEVPQSAPQDAPVDAPPAESEGGPPIAPKENFNRDWVDEETPPPTEEEMHAWVLAAVAAEASDLKAQSSALMDAMPHYREVQAPNPAPAAVADLEAESGLSPVVGEGIDDGEDFDDQQSGEPRLSFMAPEQAPSVWSRPSVRGALIALAMLLGIALGLQVLVHQRDRLAAKAPATRPLVDGLCGLVGCQVQPLREIEAVVIDSSAFVKIRPNTYRVHFTLKNTAVYAVGMPSLELTLTNTADQAIVRRVFSPHEFGIDQASLVPGAEMNAVVSIGVQLADASERVSGYRLLVFYP